MSVEDSVVAIYQTHTDADRAVKELQRGGVDMHKLSIVGKVTSSFPQADKSRTLRRRRCRQRSGRIIESGSECVNHRIAELSALVHGIGDVRSAMARYTARSRELSEKKS